jgi:hypothetical protein
MQTSKLSFDRDIRPLFRSMDIDHMSGMDVMLDDYTYMSNPANAQAVYEYLNGTQQPQMPPGGPYWSDEHLKLFAQWMEQGRQP